VLRYNADTRAFLSRKTTKKEGSGRNRRRQRAQRIQCRSMHIDEKGGSQ
jgi:hypothetical protein